MIESGREVMFDSVRDLMENDVDEIAVLAEAARQSDAITPHSACVRIMAHKS